MRTFKNHIVEEALNDLSTPFELDRKFIRSAMSKITQLNLSAKDFESLENKAEIQYLITTTYFPEFDWKKLNMKGFDTKKLNDMVAELRSQSMFSKFYAWTPRGVGPGEVMFYYLVNDAKLAGGKEGGDLRIGNNTYEIKSATISWAQKAASGFRLGGTFKMPGLMKDVFDLLEKTPEAVKLGKEKSGINKKQMAVLLKKYPREMKKIMDEWKRTVHSKYFSKYDFIFTDNTSKTRKGEIAYAGPINPNMIDTDSVTQGEFKPIIRWR